MEKLLNRQVGKRQILVSKFSSELKKDTNKGSKNKGKETSRKEISWQGADTERN